MSVKNDKFAKALDQLITDGDMLHMAMQYDCYGEAFSEQAKKQLGKEEVENCLNDLPNLKEKYQAWYSKAQALVKQVLPDLRPDFPPAFGRIRRLISGLMRPSFPVSTSLQTPAA